MAAESTIRRDMLGGRVDKSERASASAGTTAPVFRYQRGSSARFLGLNYADDQYKTT